MVEGVPGEVASPQRYITLASGLTLLHEMKTELQNYEKAAKHHLGTLDLLSAITIACFFNSAMEPPTKKLFC